MSEPGSRTTPLGWKRELAHGLIVSQAEWLDPHTASVNAYRCVAAERGIPLVEYPELDAMPYEARGEHFCHSMHTLSSDARIIAENVAREIRDLVPEVPYKEPEKEMSSAAVVGHASGDG